MRCSRRGFGIWQSSSYDVCKPVTETSWRCVNRGMGAVYLGEGDERGFETCRLRISVRLYPRALALAMIVDVSLLA